MTLTSLRACNSWRPRALALAEESNPSGNTTRPRNSHPTPPPLARVHSHTGLPPLAGFVRSKSRRPGLSVDDCVRRLKRFTNYSCFALHQILTARITADRSRTQDRFRAPTHPVAPNTLPPEKATVSRTVERSSARCAKTAFGLGRRSAPGRWKRTSTRFGVRPDDTANHRGLGGQAMGRCHRHREVSAGRQPPADRSRPPAASSASRFLELPEMEPF